MFNIVRRLKMIASLKLLELLLPREERKRIDCLQATLCGKIFIYPIKSISSDINSSSASSRRRLISTLPCHCQSHCVRTQKSDGFLNQVKISVVKYFASLQYFFLGYCIALALSLSLHLHCLLTKTPLNFLLDGKKGISLSAREMKDFLVLEIEDGRIIMKLRCCMLRFCLCMSEQRNGEDGNTDDSTSSHPPSIRLN